MDILFDIFRAQNKKILISQIKRSAGVIADVSTPPVSCRANGRWPRGGLVDTPWATVCRAQERGSQLKVGLARPGCNTPSVKLAFFALTLHEHKHHPFICTREHEMIIFVVTSFP
jgi:hypothetical protein